MQCAQQEIKDEGAADGLLGEIDIAECHICVVLKRRRDRIPRWRLLASSASALGRDPADEERLAGVDGGLDEVVEARLGALVHLVEVPVGVDAREERDRRDAEHRGSGQAVTQHWLSRRRGGVIELERNIAGLSSLQQHVFILHFSCKRLATAGNRTRVARVAGEHHTTRPQLLGGACDRRITIIVKCEIEKSAQPTAFSHSSSLNLSRRQERQ